MKIYTKTGDDGTTSLFDGTRVSKDHERVDLYGEVDELNGIIGLALTHIQDQSFRDTLMQIQKDLFALGAKLANPDHKKQKEKADFDETKVEFLETNIDTMESGLQPMKNFILPGGTTASGTLHLARCVCRRCERKTVHLAKTEQIDTLHIQYLNRLSDYLFVAARFANHLQNTPDIEWT